MNTSLHPRELLAELAEEVGPAAAARLCADLLDGGHPAHLADVLPYVGGRPAALLLQSRIDDGWARAWGARGLLYVWSDDVSTSVVRGLGDPFWRVAENCLKVSTRRELAGAAAGAVALAGHRLARVRAQALRTLGEVGDSEHVGVVESAHDDTESSVQAAAERSHRRLVERLDLPRVDDR